MTWRWLKLILPILFLAPVVWQAIVSNEPIVVKTNFTTRTAYFSRLLPEGRVELLSKYILVNTEPIYFDLLLPPRSTSVNISLKANLLPDNLQLGVRQGGGWDYVFPEQKLVNGERVIVVDSFPYIPNHTLRILVSAPDSNGKLILEKVTAKIYRKPFNFNYAQELYNTLNQAFVEKFWNPTVKIFKPRYEEPGAITTD